MFANMALKNYNRKELAMQITGRRAIQTIGTVGKDHKEECMNAVSKE